MLLHVSIPFMELLFFFVQIIYFDQISIFGAINGLHNNNWLIVLCALCFVGPDLSLCAPDLIEMDPKTGLIVPKPNTKMLVADGRVIDIPSNHFVHPQTGRVLPIQGNVAFDPITSKLVFTADSATGTYTVVIQLSTSVNASCILTSNIIFHKLTNSVNIFGKWQLFII